MSQPLFNQDEKLQFQKEFIIHFLAASEALNYQKNCDRGWEHHAPLVEDAECLAEKVWDKMVEHKLAEECDNVPLGT